MRVIAICILAALGAGATNVVSPPESPVNAAADINALAWMSGTWTGTEDKIEVEEIWMAPKGGAMIGMHRDVKDDKMTGFEFLRIATKGDKIAYFASPNGAPPTVFPMKEMAEKRVVFENPDHDYPQRIIYWLEKDGALKARIEGDKNGKMGPMEWTWRHPEAPKAK